MIFRISLKTFSSTLFLAILLYTGELSADQSQYRQFSILLPKGSKKIGENRYQSGLSYDDTKREYHYRFLHMNNIKRLGQEINLPHVRAIFYQNLDPSAEFFAINIYQNAQTRLTEIFFVTHKTSREGKL